MQYSKLRLEQSKSESQIDEKKYIYRQLFQKTKYRLCCQTLSWKRPYAFVPGREETVQSAKFNVQY